MFQSVQNEAMGDPFAIVVCMVDLVGIFACINANQKRITGRENCCKVGQKFGRIVTCEVANAGTQGEDALRSLTNAD